MGFSKRFRSLFIWEWWGGENRDNVSGARFNCNGNDHAFMEDLSCYYSPSRYTPMWGDAGMDGVFYVLTFRGKNIPPSYTEEGWLGQWTQKPILFARRFNSESFLCGSLWLSTNNFAWYCSNCCVLSLSLSLFLSSPSCSQMVSVLPRRIQYVP